MKHFGERVNYEINYQRRVGAYGIILQNNDLILMDFGLRWQSMCTDVSRTIPYGGRYTDLQKRLMDIVLITQEKTMAQVKPGISFNDLNDYAWTTLEKNLELFFESENENGNLDRLYLEDMARSR